MGMVDIRILVNIHVRERPLHPHHNNHFINNTLRPSNCSSLRDLNCTHSNYKTQKNLRQYWRGWGSFSQQSNPATSAITVAEIPVHSNVQKAQ
jgi:hypothetical protein